MYIRFTPVIFNLPGKQITIQIHLHLSKNVYFVLRHWCFIRIITNDHHIVIKSQISDIKWQNICTSFDDLKNIFKIHT